MQKILIVIDMQNDFVTGVLGSKAAQSVVEPILEKATWYRENGYGVLFTMDTHQQGTKEYEESREAELVPPHCIKGTEGWRIVEQLRPLSENCVVTKPTFLSAELPDRIRTLYGDQVELELCGVCTDICVVSNALCLRGAFPSARILVDSGCCAGTSSDNHQAALKVMRSCLIEVR